MEEQIRALADPRRRRILELVQDQELAAGEIAAHFQVTRPAISQHLGVLKQAGLVGERRDGTRRLYRSRPEGLLGLKQFVDRMWATGLGRLKEEAEREAGSTERKDVRADGDRR